MQTEQNGLIVKIKIKMIRHEWFCLFRKDFALNKLASYQYCYLCGKNFILN